MRFRCRVVFTAVATLFIIYILCHIVLNTPKPAIEKPSLRDYVLKQKIEPKTTRILELQHSPTAAQPNIFKHNQEMVQNAKKATLKTLRGSTPIFVYPPEIDNMISSRLRTHGTWEDDLLNITGKILLKNRDMVFVDIGCNIGVYTLSIAKLGSRVVCVEPVRNNLKLLSQSLEAGRLSDHVIMVNNAISDSRRNASIFIPDQNVGGAYIQDGDNIQHGGQSVDTITLDDLTVLVKGRKVFLKIDIEGHEQKALSSGQIFFQSVDVRGILMEWVHHKYTETGDIIIKLLIKNGLLPYEDGNRNILLDPDLSYRWPENIFWFKR